MDIGAIFPGGGDVVEPDQMCQRQSQQIFIEGAGLLRIAAPIGVVVKPLDVHGFDASLVLCDLARWKHM
jgi:hypothetical protein